MRAAIFLLRRRSIARGVEADLATRATLVSEAPISLPARSLKIFISCAEPSGEAHAIWLVRQLREVAADLKAPEPEFSGLGSPLLAAEGVRIVGDPVQKAAMGADAAKSVGFYRKLLTDAATELAGPDNHDVCVPVDSPALHVPLGHIAKAYGIPVVHYVTPQYWAWAPWRVGGYRKAVDLALTILPFEASWFDRHGVASAYVGHPQLDVLAEEPNIESERTSLLLLPGSRSAVIRRNLPFLLNVLSELRTQLPDLDVVLPQERDDRVSEIKAILEEHGASVRISTGSLHAELARARAALSVSGTILLDVLHHRVPAVAVYHASNALLAKLQRRILSVPWFTSVNLLAAKEVVPEYAFHGDGPVKEVAGRLLKWLTDDEAHSAAMSELNTASTRLGPQGAAKRAAEQVLIVAAGRQEGSAT